MSNTQMNNDGYVEIEAFKDAKFKESAGSDLVMNLMFKQDSLSFNRKVLYEEGGESGNSLGNLKFKEIAAESLNFEFLFDRTGVIPRQEYLNEGIRSDLEKFSRIIGYNDEIHRPNYIRLVWNGFVFKGDITDVSTTYKLFGKDGVPLRAIVKITIKESIDKNEAIKTSTPKSPDLTHSRVVQEGDTLPLMTYRIYGDSKYYLEVARANKLSNFRKLEVGSTIYFPSIEK